MDPVGAATPDLILPRASRLHPRGATRTTRKANLYPHLRENESDLFHVGDTF